MQCYKVALTYNFLSATALVDSTQRVSSRASKTTPHYVERSVSSSSSGASQLLGYE
jgi:hypothetical protein